MEHEQELSRFRRRGWFFALISLLSLPGAAYGIVVNAFSVPPTVPLWALILGVVYFVAFIAFCKINTKIEGVKRQMRLNDFK